MENNLIKKIVPVMAGLIALAGCSFSNIQPKIIEKPGNYTLLEKYCLEAEINDSYNKVGIIIPYTKYNFEMAKKYIEENKTEGCVISLHSNNNPDFEKFKTGDVIEGYRVIFYNPPLPDFEQEPEEPEVEKVPKEKFIMA